MKRPIEVSEIRKGDRIETEYVDRNDTHYDVTYTARTDGHVYDGAPIGAAYYLLDRPEPAVELPTEPSLGWLTITAPGGSFPQRTELAAWFAKDSFGKMRAEATGHVVDGDWATDFVRAIAVPQDALDVLRSNADCSGPLSCLRDHVEDFLLAVDSEGQS